jgi:penicillin-binding protein 1A
MKQKFFKASLDQEPEVEGALVSLNSHTGEILTMVGGVDFQKSQFNRACLVVASVAPITE